MDISGKLSLLPRPVVEQAPQASTDGDDSGDEVGARKGGRRSAFRSLGVAAHDAWVSQNEGAVEGSEEPESTVTAAEGEQAANSDGDQSSGGQRGSDTRAGVLLSQARKKWGERICAPQETAPRTGMMGILLDAVSESMPLQRGSRHAIRIQIVSRLVVLAKRIVAARRVGRHVFVGESLTEAEWADARSAGDRPGLLEVGMALHEHALEELAIGSAPPHNLEIDNALLPLRLLQSLAPAYSKKRGISTAVRQVQMKRLSKQLE